MENYTLQNIREECHKRLRQSTSNPLIWSDVKVDNYINSAQLDIVKRTNCLWGMHVFEVSVDSQYFTLPSDVFNIPRRRVVYDEDEHLTFYTLDQLQQENGDWEDADSGTPDYWFQKGQDKLWIHPPADTAGNVCTFEIADDDQLGDNEDLGIIVAISDDATDAGTHTMSLATDAQIADVDYGIIVSISDDSSADRHKMISYSPNSKEIGAIVDILDPTGNVKINYVRTPSIMKFNADKPEIADVYYYTIIYYTLWKAYEDKTQGQNMQLAKIYMDEYFESINYLQSCDLGSKNTRQTRMTS